MIDAKGLAERGSAAARQRLSRWRARRATPIVPAGDIAGRAMVLVIAIMTFLSCLALGGVTLVRDTASSWQSQISREATVEIKPAEGFDMEGALVAAQAIAARYPGVRAATIVDKAATARLLEPWLGSGVDIDALPVPRLVVVTIDTGSPPDFAAMRAELQAKIANASLDDHRNWADRLVTMARTTVTTGIAIFVLMLSATALTVVFAARAAMSGNGHVIDVLHFIGAEARFIAGEFRRHFLVAGMKGAAAGGIAAVLVFIGFSWWSSASLATPQASQTTALFGNFAIGAMGYAGVVLVVFVVSVLTALTSHLTVIFYLRDVEMRHPDGG